MRKLLLGVTTILLVFCTACNSIRHWREKGEISKLNLLQAEMSYLKGLDGILNANPNPESQSSASVFLSGTAINSVLTGFDDSSLAVPQIKNASVSVHRVRADFRDGFPGIIAEITLTKQNPNLSIDAQLYCVLEPRIDPADGSSLLLFIHPLYISIGHRAISPSLDEMRFADNVLGDLASQYVQALPHLTIPLSKDFSVAFPATQLPLVVPTQAGHLNGDVDIPGLSVTSEISISGVFFLADGIHALVKVHPPNAKTQAELPYKIIPSSTRPSDEKTVENEISETSKQIEVMRSKLKPKTDGLKVTGSDVRIWISKSLISTVGDVFNSLTSSQRTVKFHSISQDGQIYRTGGGGLGCGGYAELVSGNSANADLALSNLASTWSPSGIQESMDFAFSFHAQVTGHVNGPAGPHTTMVLNCVNLGFARPCTNLPSVTVSCETPIGGGAGLGSYGISGDRTERLTANLNLHSDGTNWLIYDLALASPDQIPITISVGLGQLGTAGFPISFGIPHQVILSGKAPPLFAQYGIIDIPNSSIHKKYVITLKPTAGSANGDGYSALGTLDVQWK
jgi:hypothetical protein